MGRVTAPRLVIDGMNVAHIMRHVHSELRVNVPSKLGGTEPLHTGVLYGALRMLDSLIRQFSPSEVIFVWDGIDSCWRQQLMPEYKSNRAKRQKALSPSEKHAMRLFRDDMIPDLRKCLRFLGIPCIEIDGYEADDIIGALAYYTRKEGSGMPPLVIVSTDADYVQCVKAGRVRVYNQHTNCLYYQQPDTGMLFYGGSTKPLAPSPKTFFWRKALIGDPADGIKGVSGIGKGRAAGLFTQRELTEKETLREYWQRLHANGALNCPDATFQFVMRSMADIQRVLLVTDLVYEHAFAGRKHVMRITGKAARLVMRQQAGTAYRKSVQDAYIKESKGVPRFLAPPFTRDPSPALNFFRRREFQVAYYPRDFSDMLQRYAALWDSRQRFTLFGSV